jgi:hypothetical protein
MELEEILGGSIAVLIVVLFGLIVLPLAERVTGQSMLLLTVPVTVAGAVVFVRSLRALGRLRGTYALSVRIQATRAGIVFAAGAFWSVILALTFRYSVIEVYESLDLDGKFLVWSGITWFIVLRVYLSLLTRTSPREEMESLGVREEAAALKQTVMRKG